MTSILLPTLMLAMAISRTIIARAVGIELEWVDLGIGPKLCQFKVLGTTWRLRPLPVAESARPRLLPSQPEPFTEPDRDLAKTLAEEAREHFPRLWWRYLALIWSSMLGLIVTLTGVLMGTGRWDVVAWAGKDVLRVLLLRDAGWSLSGALEAPMATATPYLITVVILVNMLPIVGNPLTLTGRILLRRSQSLTTQVSRVGSIASVTVLLYAYCAIAYALLR